MRTLYSFLLFLPMMYVVGMVFPTVKADELTSSSIDDIQSDQMEIIVDVWPKEILSGDYIYVLFSVKNKSQETLEVQPSDFFDNDAPINRGRFRATGHPYYHFMSGAKWGEFRGVNTGIVTVLPGETRLVLTDVFAPFPDGKHTTITVDGKHVLRDIDIEPIEFYVANFKEKYDTCVQQPWPTLHVNKRPTGEEWRLVNSLHSYSSEFRGVSGRGLVKTASGDYTMQVFVPAIDLDINPYSDQNIPNFSAWKAFEERFSPGTFRDMIRLARIQIQYLDDQKVSALEELRDWFAEMEPIQSIVLAASLCLPEGLDVESENDMKFMFITEMVSHTEREAYLESRRESHKHYMAMRRAFDEVVRSYNTLPKRKLREKGGLE